MKAYIPLKPGHVLGFEHTKPIYIADRLEDLNAVLTGMVVLPNHLDWTPSNHYYVANPRDLYRLYETVLNEASDEEDLIAYLNHDFLVENWRQLPMSRNVREVWEDAYPDLKAVSTNAE